MSGDGPSNVAGQVGMYAKIVDWVQSAHEHVQLQSTRWRFDWGTVSVSLTSGDSTYDPYADWGGISVRSWAAESLYVYKESIKARTWLGIMPWSDFRHVSQAGATGRPAYLSIAPDRTVNFYPIPTDGLTFVGEYYKRPMVLVSNTDEPRIPLEHRMTIVWQAVMLWAASEENPVLYQAASKKYEAAMENMMDVELVGPDLAGPLA